MKTKRTKKFCRSRRSASLAAYREAMTRYDRERAARVTALDEVHRYRVGLGRLAVSLAPDDVPGALRRMERALERAALFDAMEAELAARMGDGARTGRRPLHVDAAGGIPPGVSATPTHDERKAVFARRTMVAHRMWDEGEAIRDIVKRRAADGIAADLSRRNVVRHEAIEHPDGVLLISSITIVSQPEE